MMSAVDEVRQLFEKLPKAFLPEKAGDLQATIQIKLSGEGASDWAIKIAEGTIAVNEGEADSPEMTLYMDAADYIALIRGEANPMSLFAAGRVRLEGDMGLALKFQQMFSRG